MRRSTFVALLVAGALLIPAAVYASHQFTDVPNSHTFHNAIDWMKDNNITVGCNPPANTRYCPDDNVSRGQMAAFMRRLADNQVVDAGALAGRSPGAYQGSVAGDLINNVTPAALAPTVIASLSGFAVPQNGGALAASADVNMLAGAPGGVIVWIEVDGTGGCTSSLPPTGVIHDFVAEQFAFLGTSTTAAANTGSHRVDLCAVTEVGSVTFGQGALTVEWIEDTQIATTEGASSGRSFREVFDEMRSSTFGE